MRKLIRDKIAANRLHEGGSHKVYALATDFEHAQMLSAKLDEEVAELKGSDDSDNTLEEAADVLEVLTSIVALHGYTLKDLLRRQHEKHQLSGGFENRYVLETES